MISDGFEWDDNKAARNWREHDISFEMARDVFKDPFAIYWDDHGQDEGEDRFVTVGMVELSPAVRFLHATRRTYPDHLGPPGGTL